MAENALTKKLGPQPRWAWGAEILGGFLLFVIITRRRRASSGGLRTTNVTATPLSGGTTIPSSGGQSLPSPTTFSNLAGWIQAFLGQAVSAQYPASAALNDATAWINGSCVSAQGFSAIGSFILSAGLPPGFSTPPTLSVCPTTGTNAGNPPPPSAPPPPPAPPPSSPSPSPISTPPALSTIASHVIGNVVSIFQEGTGWTYVTDRGYVYNSPGSTYYGGTNDGKIGGPIASHIVSAQPITSGPNQGGYTLIASNGDTYNFGPSANLANA